MQYYGESIPTLALVARIRECMYVNQPEYRSPLLKTAWGFLISHPQWARKRPSVMSLLRRRNTGSEHYKRSQLPYAAPV